MSGQLCFFVNLKLKKMFSSSSFSILGPSKFNLNSDGPENGVKTMDIGECYKAILVDKK